MNSRKVAVYVLLILFCAAILSAKDFWENPFNKWNRDNVLKMLGDSPWAASQTITSAGMTKEGGRGGENETFYKFTASFFSALPIREAYVRRSMLMNNYDSMAAEQKQQFDARFNKPLTLDFSDRIVVTLEYASSPNDANFARDLKTFLDTETAETLRQNVYLISKSLGRVDLKEYYRPGQMLPVATFVFPRVVDGKQVVNPEDKEVRFQVGWLAGVNQQVYIDFKPQKMTYKGKFEI